MSKIANLRSALDRRRSLKGPGISTSHPLMRKLNKTYKLAFIFGTRPELIKLAPLIREVKKYPEYFTPVLVHTGQHEQMTRGILPLFGIPETEISRNFKVMKKGLLLEEKLGYMVAKIGKEYLEKERPDMVIIQGDSESSFAAKLAADYHLLPVALVEAGLRTHNMFYPFPEEIHRLHITCASDLTLYFAPTLGAKDNLMREGIAEDKITVTGNTIVDALNMMKDRKVDLTRFRLPENKKIILFTCHRREVFGYGMKAIFGVIKTIAKKFEKDVHVVYPVHMNPNVKEVARQQLGGISNIQLVEPLAYDEMIALMSRSYLVVTDSGGIQEEAPSLGKPVIVVRNITERPEAIELGVAEKVNIDRPEELAEKIEETLTIESKYAGMTRKVYPFGKGDASRQILAGIGKYFGVPLPERDGPPPIKEKGTLSAAQELESRMELIKSLVNVPDLSVDDIDSAIKNAVRWLTESGIQNENGSFSGYFDVAKSKHTFAYPEITGYGVVALLELHKTMRNDNYYMEKAKKAADWLISELKNAGMGMAVPAREYYNRGGYVVPDFQKYYYAFDAGIVINAMVEMYKQSMDMKYLKAATDLAEFLIGTCKITGSSPFACFDPETKAPINPGTAWSTHAGPFLAKISEGLINLYKVTGNWEYLKAALSVCDKALKYQAGDGRFITSPKKKNGETHAHPHCYAAEGLLFTGRFLQEMGIEKTRAQKYIWAAAMATKWLLDNMTPKGNIRHRYEEGEFLPYERSDSLAQTINLACELLDKIAELTATGKLSKKVKQVYRTVHLPALVKHLLEYQTGTGANNMELFLVDGFKFGTDSSWAKGASDTNAWCTMFAIKALRKYRDLG